MYHSFGGHSAEQSVPYEIRHLSMWREAEENTSAENAAARTDTARFNPVTSRAARRAAPLQRRRATTV